MSLSAREEHSEDPYPGSLWLDAVLIQVVIQLVVGVILSVSYIADPGKAHATVAGMHEGKLRLLQSLHYWGSFSLILQSLGLVVVSAWKGWFRRPFRLEYFIGLAVFGIAVGFQLSGNVLPFDKHGVETASVEAGIAARAPGVGSSLRELILHGTSFSRSTLSLWYGAHWVLGILAVVLVGLRLWRLKGHPRAVGESRWTAALALIPFVLAGAVPSPFGAAATPADFGSFDARVSWYTWPLHGALVMLDHVNAGLGWVGAMLVPGLIGLALILLPLFRGKAGLVVARSALAVGALFFGVAAAFYGGSFAPLTGTRDPVEQVAVATSDQAPQDVKLAAQGKALFATQGCNSCHGDNGDKGGAGPSLLKEGVRHADAAFYEKYIHSPTSVDPQSTMPAFPSLSQSQLAAMAEFLRFKRG